MAETGTLWGEPVERDIEQDMGDSEAWRFIKLCDDNCHHPMHAFQKSRQSTHHLEWFTYGTAPIRNRKSTD